MIFFLGDHMKEKIYAFKRVIYNGVTWYAMVIVNENTIRVELDNGKKKYTVAKIQYDGEIPNDVWNHTVPKMLDIAREVVSL